MDKTLGQEWTPSPGDAVFVQECRACHGGGSVDDNGSADCAACDGKGWYVTPCRCGCYAPFTDGVAVRQVAARDAGR